MLHTTSDMIRELQIIEAAHGDLTIVFYDDRTDSAGEEFDVEFFLRADTGILCAVVSFYSEEVVPEHLYSEERK